MPHKSQSQSVQKKQRDEREPDDLKEGERMSQVGRRGNEYEDVEESRTKSRRGDEDLDEIDDDDIIDEVDLDASPEGDGPDA